MTTAIVEALRKRYPEPAYALITEVRNGTGYQRVRTGYADALAMGCWPSRGLDVQGFEFKVSRSDWLREWKNPVKAETFVKFCDYWYVVAGDDEIVKREELPKSWGLLVVNGKSLKTVVDAPKLEPQPLDRLFVASILRSLCDQVLPQKKLDDARRAGLDEGFKNGAESEKRDAEYLRKEIAEIKQAHEKMIRDFERKSGLTLNNWSAGNIGDAVQRVMNSEHLRIEERLLALKGTAQNILAAIDVALEHEKIKAQR
jgi:hypothetical protein